MKVLAAIVAPPHLSVSGAARAAERLSVELARSCEISIASMMPEGTWNAGVRHFPVHSRLPVGLRSMLPKRYRAPFYRSDIGDLIRPGQFDLLHIHNPMPAMEMERIARACRRADIPYVVSTHGYQEIALGRTIYGFGPARRLLWDRLVYRPVARATAAADGVLLLSEEDRLVVQRMGYSRDSAFVVPNGIEACSCPAKAIAAVRAKFELHERDGNRLTCMFLANHTPNKGIRILFEAFGLLDIPYVLIVGGEQREGIDYGGFAASLLRGQRVVFTGRLPDLEVAALMRQSDLFVFPTLADTLPLVIQEALAAGLPVVASTVGGIPRQIDASCGILVPPGNARALADAVRGLACDRDRLRALRRGAERRFRSLPDWRECADSALLAYLLVLARRRVRRRTQGRPVPGPRTTIEAVS
jgi:glycosyltransferase involved in cell wall biosynthesis